ncbi:MAG: hypothetical protein ABIH66_10915, partial [bacterium]
MSLDRRRFRKHPAQLLEIFFIQSVDKNKYDFETKIHVSTNEYYPKFDFGNFTDIEIINNRNNNRGVANLRD